MQYNSMRYSFNRSGVSRQAEHEEHEKKIAPIILYAHRPRPLDAEKSRQHQEITLNRFVQNNEVAIRLGFFFDIVSLMEPRLLALVYAPQM